MSSRRIALHKALPTTEIVSAKADGPDPTISPEVDALIATNLLYWKLEDKLCESKVLSSLTKHERHVLLRLDQPMRMGVLASEMQVLPSTLTMLATSLEAAGLILKVRDPLDKRAHLLQLTEKGAGVRLDAMARAARVFAEVTGLNPDEIKTFSTLARKYKAHILLDGIPKGLTL